MEPERDTLEGDVERRVAMSAGSRRPLIWAAAISLLAGAGACSGLERTAESATVETAPDSFVVGFETSAGDFAMTFHRAWSPVAVDRVYRLVQERFWEGARIYRVNDRYAQFGYSGRPGLDSTWVLDAVPDEPVGASNVRGAVSFARGGPDTRSAILFINRSDNSDLDDIEWNGVLGFPPVGSVSEGMDVVDRLYAGYGDEPMQWEDSIASVGNPFIDRKYPELDSIRSVRLLDDRN